MLYNLDKTIFISSGFDEPVLYAPARIGNLHSCSSLNIVVQGTIEEFENIMCGKLKTTFQN